MFGFGKSGKDPLADIKSAERWMASFPANDPLAPHGEILAELARVTERAHRRTPAELAAVFRVDAGTAAIRRALVAQYVEHASRSSKIEHQLWSAIFDLTQAFLLAYQAFAKDVTDHPSLPKWRDLEAELVGRRIAHMALDAKVRLFRYEQWIPAKWADLHALFSLACSRQFERQALNLGLDSAATTIEHEYLQVLLLQVMNAGNASARQLDWIAAELDVWSSGLKLTLEPASASAFYVDLASREGMKRRTAPGALEGRVLFLDTRPLHAVLLQNVVMLEDKIRREPLSDRTSRRSDQLALMTKLASQVDPEYRPLARRGERTAAAGVVDALVGFARITGFLREEEREPLPLIAPGDSFGGTMDLAVFGHIRNEKDRRLELAKRRLGAFASPGGPWEVKDVSHTGFRLLAPMSVANAVTLGTLTAIRAHGQPQWSLGIVRRMRRMTSERAEIGLQVIASTLLCVDLLEQRRNAADDYSVDGESTTINGRSFAGLFLTLKRRDGDAVVQSLIVPAVEYQPSKRLRLVAAGTNARIRFGRLIEQQPEWVWATVEALDAITGIPSIIRANPTSRTAANE